MKDTFWNLLTGLTMFGVIIALILFLVVFTNPHVFFNPLPPPKVPELLILPSPTPTQRSVPDVVKPGNNVVEPTEVPAEVTARPSSTPLPTSTSFVLPTKTITPTPTATATETPTITPTSSAYGCNVVSSSPSYNASFPPGGDFDGRWTLQNTGTESWGDIVDLIYISGAKFQAYADAVDLPKSVAPGESVDVVVDMLAPRDPGTYKTIWRLRRSDTTFCEVTLQIVVK